MGDAARAFRAWGWASGFAVSAIAILVVNAPLAAEEVRIRADMPSLCKSIGPQLEMGQMAKDGEGEAVSKRMDAEIAKGECRIGKSQAKVNVVDVDQRGFALVEEEGQPGKWWMDAGDVWDYFKADAIVKAWKKP